MRAVRLRFSHSKQNCDFAAEGFQRAIGKPFGGALGLNAQFEKTYRSTGVTAVSDYPTQWATEY